MQNRRIRLDDDERMYIIDLIEENNRFQGRLMSLSIRRLLKKLSDASESPQMARVRIDFKEKPCTVDGCAFVAKSGAGLSRHIASRHEEKGLLDAKDN